MVVSLLRQRGAIINGDCQHVVDAAQRLVDGGGVKKGAYAGVLMQVKTDPALANLAGVLKVKAHVQLHESEGPEPHLMRLETTLPTKWRGRLQRSMRGRAPQAQGRGESREAGEISPGAGPEGAQRT